MSNVYFRLFTCCILILAQASNAQTQLTFYTTKGNFVVKLEENKAPITTANFIKLVNMKFFDGIIFHRVVKNFVIQGGDPTGTGNGGPGYTIADEFDSMSNVQKTIGMANEGTPHSGGSQFYINLVNNIFLDHKYSVFGTVITNFTVVQNIGKVIVDGSDRPLTNVVMDSVRITIPTGIGQVKKKLQYIAIKPNPISVESVVSIYSDTERRAEVSIYNQYGVRVFNRPYSLSQGSNAFSLHEFETNTFSSGIYYFMLTDGTNITEQKFVVL